MAINTYPAIASPVKSVQRGSAAGAGTVTITSVDTSKSFVLNIASGKSPMNQPRCPDSDNLNRFIMFWSGVVESNHY